IYRLCAAGDAGGVIGWLLAEGIVPPREVNSFLVQLVSEPNEKFNSNIENCVGGFLAKLTPEQRTEILSALIITFSGEEAKGEEKITRLLKCAPFNKGTWRQVDALPSELREKYRKEEYPRWQ